MKQSLLDPIKNIKTAQTIEEWCNYHAEKIKSIAVGRLEVVDCTFYPYRDSGSLWLGCVVNYQNGGGYDFTFQEVGENEKDITSNCYGVVDIAEAIHAVYILAKKLGIEAKIS